MAASHFAAREDGDDRSNAFANASAVLSEGGQD